MGIWQIYRQKREIERCARELPARLRRSYGTSETYTKAQIGAAIGALKLRSDTVAFAYAAFLVEEAYGRLSDEIRCGIPYAEARSTFFDHVPRTWSTSVGDCIEITSGVPGGSGGGSCGPTGCS